MRDKYKYIGPVYDFLSNLYSGKNIHRCKTAMLDVETVKPGDRILFAGVKQPIQVFALRAPGALVDSGDLFSAAVDEYLGGRWETARSLLHQAKHAIADGDPGDLAGVISFLMRFIEKYDFKCPDAWRGFRKATWR